MSKAVAAKKAGRNPKQTFEDGLKALARNRRKAYLDRFKELMEEHGCHNLVVFPLSDSEMATLALAAQVNEDGNVHNYAKTYALSWATTDTEELTMKIKKGVVKL